MKRTLFFLCALLIAALFLSAHSKASTSAVSLYNRGNELFKGGKIDEARDAYQKAVDAGAIDAALFFNLANAEFRSGNLGRAILNYLRAQRLAPRDSDIEFNLEYARSKIAARPQELEKGPFTRVFNAVTNFLSADEWTLCALISYWAACLAVVGLIYFRQGTASKTARVMLYTSLIVLALLLPFAATRVKRDVFTPRAVIVAEKTVARSGPGEDNAGLFDLHEGIDVAVGQCEMGWCRVSAPGGFIGWVEAKSFERF
jgi:hypothetical protein